MLCTYIFEALTMHHSKTLNITTLRCTDRLKPSKHTPLAQGTRPHGAVLLTGIVSTHAP